MERGPAPAIGGVAYPRRVAKRICHLGLGRFHRAHQAVYLHELLTQGDGEGWGICGIGLREADRPALQALRGQDHLYTVREVDGPFSRETVVGSIMETIDAAEDWSHAIGMLSDPWTRIVSFTITEAGYADQPRSAIELVTHALAARRSGRIGGLTLLSCDNLIENGARLRDAALRFAHRHDRELAKWIEAECAFPCSMVDRITPAGDDPLTVVCEPWRQWIVEDHFVADRPALEKAGVVFSDEVTDYEDLKMSLLNGGHCAIAHLGLLLGHERVDEAMADPLVRGFLSGYLSEVAEVVRAPAGIRVDEYQASLIHRFSNVAIRDQLARLAQDTHQKLEQALVPPLLARVRAGLRVPYLAASIALWLHDERREETGLPIPKRARDEVAAQLSGLRERGVRAAVAAIG